MGLSILCTVYTKHIAILFFIGIWIVLTHDTFQASPIGGTSLAHLFDFVGVLH